MSKIITIECQGIDDMGCCVYFSIKVNEDYTMRQIVEEVKRQLGFRIVKFRIVSTMKCFADVL